MNKKMENKIELKIDTETKNKLRKLAFENNISLAATARIAINKFLNACDEEKIFNKDAKFKRELIYEFRRFGNNINQIAHQLNIAAKKDDLRPSKKIEIESAIHQIDNLSEILERAYSLAEKRL